MRGTTKPPPTRVNGKRVSDYLPATIADIKIVEQDMNSVQEETICRNILFETVAVTTLTKKGALKYTRMLFQKVIQNADPGRKYAAIFYSGHGTVGTGNWCFNEGRVGLEDILEIARHYSAGFDCLDLVLDCCCSGNWCVELQKVKDVDFDINIYAASWKDRLTWGNDEGSFWTRFMYQKNEITNPKTESRQIRWTLASRTRQGVYKITHMRADKDVETEWRLSRDHFRTFKSVVDDIDSNLEKIHQMFHDHGHRNPSTWTKTERDQYYSDYANLVMCFVQLRELKVKIDAFQGASFLENEQLSKIQGRNLAFYLAVDQRMKEQRLLDYNREVAKRADLMSTDGVLYGVPLFLIIGGTIGLPIGALVFGSSLCTVMGGVWPQIVKLGARTLLPRDDVKFE